MAVIILSVVCASIAGALIGMRKVALLIIGVLTIYGFIQVCRNLIPALSAALAQLFSQVPAADHLLPVIVSYLLLIIAVFFPVAIGGYKLEQKMAKYLQGKADATAGSLLGAMSGYATAQIFDLKGFIACLCFSLLALVAYLSDGTKSHRQNKHLLRQQEQQQHRLEQQQQSMIGGEPQDELDRPFWPEEQSLNHGDERDEWHDNGGDPRNQTFQGPDLPRDQRDNRNH